MLPIIPPTDAVKKGLDRENDGTSKLLSDRPTLYLYGNSIMRETGKYIDEKNMLINHDLVMNCKGGDISQILRDHPVPAAKHSKDVVALHFLGNMSLDFAKYGKPDSKWHYLHPKCLDDASVTRLVDKIISTVNTVRKTYQGTLKVIGPLPRLLGECCDDPAHRLCPPFPFNASNKDPIISYYAALNQYLVCHPKLATIGAEIVPYQLIWLNKGNFGIKCLRDNLHLGEDATKIFASFLTQLPSWKTKTYKLMDFESAFRTWAACFYGWGKKGEEAPHQAPPLQTNSAAATANAAAAVTTNAATAATTNQNPPPKPPTMPPANTEKMDHNTSHTGNENQETISSFLENAADEVANGAAGAAGTAKQNNKHTASRKSRKK